MANENTEPRYLLNIDVRHDVISNEGTFMLEHPGNPGNSPTPAALIRPFMPELDTLRGVAVSGVVLLHAFFWQYADSGLSFGRAATNFIRLTEPGWIGVNLFFVLSGFLITGILLESKDRPYYFRRFYTRRALRILPAYYGLLILLLALRSSSPEFVGLSFIYLSNMTGFFGVANDYGPLWSLAVEEHFYIVWPMVVRRLAMRGLAWASAMIVILVPACRMISFAMGWRNGLDSYTWFMADGLATGGLLAIILRTGIRRGQVKRLCWLLSGAAILMGIAGYPFGIATRNQLVGAGFQETVINLFFAGILLFFLLMGTGFGRRYVDVAALRFLGYISYGLYLNHLLAFRMYDRLCRHFFPQLQPSSNHFELVILRFLLGTTGAIVAAYLSRRFLEERFLRLKDSLVPSLPLEEAPIRAEGTQPA